MEKAPVAVGSYTRDVTFHEAPMADGARAPWSLFTTDQLEYWGKISFMKGGIVNAGQITTVSPRYAEDVQTPELGFGFDGILRRRADDLVGILNGIDTREWGPELDRFLPAPYDAKDLAGKADAKVAVLARYGLPADARSRDRPLIGMISRMVDQKCFVFREYRPQALLEALQRALALFADT